MSGKNQSCMHGCVVGTGSAAPRTRAVPFPRNGSAGFASVDATDDTSSVGSVAPQISIPPDGAATRSDAKRIVRGGVVGVERRRVTGDFLGAAPRNSFPWTDCPIGSVRHIAPPKCNAARVGRVRVVASFRPTLPGAQRPNRLLLLPPASVHRSPAAHRGRARTRSRHARGIHTYGARRVGASTGHPTDDDAGRSESMAARAAVACAIAARHATTFVHTFP